MYEFKIDYLDDNGEWDVKYFYTLYAAQKFMRGLSQDSDAYLSESDGRGNKWVVISRLSDYK